MNKIHSSLIAIIAAIFFYLSAFFSGGCAQIGMPMGGPKDSLPPVLLQASPPNHTTDFKSKRITLTFDEYVQLDNPLKNIVVSPLPVKTPFIDFKLKTVTVRLFDTLKPNTTYSIQFGNSIRDLNENNPYQNFNYVFSTGKYIDSLMIAGSVMLAETGTVDTTLTVILYSDLSDSAVLKHKPLYIAKLNSQGEFVFRNLAPGDYNIFAIKDESGQYFYNNPTQMFAFADSIVRPGIEAVNKIHLYAYQQEKPPPKISTAKKEETLKFSTVAKGETQDLLAPLEITFNNTLKDFDTAAIYLADTLFHPIKGVTYSIDSARKKIELHYNWTASTEYELLIAKDAASDSAGNTLTKNDTLRFRTKNESDYGSIKLTFKNLEKFVNPVLQLVNDKGDITSSPLTSNIFERKLFYPGVYKIQILEDKNKNGKWDPGNYKQKIQPEIVHRIKDAITIRANWENERDVIL